MLDQKILKVIKSINWKYLVNRNEAILCRSYTAACYKYFTKVTGIKWKADSELWVNSKIMHDEEELKKLRDIIFKFKISKLEKFAEKMIKYISAEHKIADQISKLGCEKLKKSQLLSWLEKYSEAALKAHNFLTPFPVSDGALTDRLLASLPEADSVVRQKWLGILVFPFKENDHTKEERDFYKLAKYFVNKNKNVDRLIVAHAKKYAWVGARGYWFKYAWTDSDIRQRLIDFVAQGKDPQKEIEHLSWLEKDRVQKANKLLKQLKIKKNTETYRLIILARKFAYWRTYRTDNLYWAGYKARNLFIEIVKRAGYAQEDASYFSYQEMLKLTKAEKPLISIEELSERKKYIAAFYYHGKHYIFSGEKVCREILDCISYLFNKDKNAIISGNTAYPGKVRGVVKKVMHVREIDKVKRGDIMVSVMTFPNFVPAMEKAAAFITDEGGILCHAAIISREMKKPCVIGTKLATQILQDGDVVEVDADSGKIIKK